MKENFQIFSFVLFWTACLFNEPEHRKKPRKPETKNRKLTNFFFFFQNENFVYKFFYCFSSTFSKKKNEKKTLHSFVILFLEFFPLWFTLKKFFWEKYCENSCFFICYKNFFFIIIFNVQINFLFRFFINNFQMMFSYYLINFIRRWKIFFVHCGKFSEGKLTEFSCAMAWI